MSVIGAFRANSNEFTAECTTLTIRATNVRIAPVQRATETGPSHRVHAGQAEVGAAWSKKSSEGWPYIWLLLEAPTLIAPFHANLLAGEDGAEHALVWSRGSRRKAE